MKMELESLRNLETIRKQHEQTLRRERDAVDHERQERKEDCERWEEEKRIFLEKVNSLEKENTKLRSRRKKGKQGTDDPVPISEYTDDDPVPTTGSTDDPVPITGSADDDSATLAGTVREDNVLPVSRSPAIAVPTPGSESPGSVSPLSEGGGERFGVGVETRSNSRNSGSLVGMVSETSSVSSDDVGSVGSGSNPMFAQFAALLKSQAEPLRLRLR